MDTAGLTGLIMQPLQTLRNPYIQQQHYGVAPSGADEAPDTPPSKRVARAVMSGTTRGRIIKRKQTSSRRQGNTSCFRGVTHHCRTGRWEAHIWQDGKQVYLGGFDNEEQAALAHDIAAIKFRAHEANTNFNVSNYAQELAHFDEVTEEEVVQSLRKQSRGAQKTSSQFRGVTKHQKGKWEARIGQMVGRKYKYLGLYKDEVEAAKAYDREAVLRRGIHAVTNFDLSEYMDLLDEAGIAEAEARHLFKPKASDSFAPALEAYTEETPQGLFYTQVAPSSQELPQSHLADMQPAEHLQLYSNGQFHVSEPFMPPTTAAMQQDFSELVPFSSLHQTQYHATAGHHGNAGETIWYGALDADSNSPANNVTAGQQGAKYVTVVEKASAPGNVSRHDTATSVFDIFNSLSIISGPEGQSYTEQEALGQHSALAEIPHMHDSNMLYHETEADDKWLEEFANSQVVAAQVVSNAAEKPLEQAAVPVLEDATMERATDDSHVQLAHQEVPGSN